MHACARSVRVGGAVQRKKRGLHLGDEKKKLKRTRVVIQVKKTTSLHTGGRSHLDPQQAPRLDTLKERKDYRKKGKIN